MDAADAIPVPANLSWEEAAAIPLTFLVVYDMLVQQGRLKRTSGCSSPAFVRRRRRGPARRQRRSARKVIGTSGSAEKLKQLKAMGLDVAIHTRKPDFHEQVMKATGGKGVNLVVNNVGGSVFAECVKCLAYEGRLATVGYLDGVMKSEIDIEALHSKRLKLFGVSNKMRNGAQRGVTVRGLHSGLPAAVRQRQVEAGDRPGLRLQGPAGGQGAHGVRRARRQDRRGRSDRLSGSDPVYSLLGLDARLP